MSEDVAEAPIEPDASLVGMGRELAGPLPKGRELAGALGFPSHVVMDSGHAAGRQMRDYAGFSDADSPNNAALIECGQHWEAASAEVAIEASLRFLRHLDSSTRSSPTRTYPANRSRRRSSSR